MHLHDCPWHPMPIVATQWVEINGKHKRLCFFDGEAPWGCGPLTMLTLAMLVAWSAHAMHAPTGTLCDSCAGLNSDLMAEMATHFPNAASILLHVAPQASRDIKV